MNINSPGRSITISKPVREEPMRFYVPENAACLSFIPFVSHPLPYTILSLSLSLSLSFSRRFCLVAESPDRWSDTTCYFWYAVQAVVSKKNLAWHTKTYRTTETVSLFVSVSFSFSLYLFLSPRLRAMFARWSSCTGGCRAASLMTG